MTTKTVLINVPDNFVNIRAITVYCGESPDFETVMLSPGDIHLVPPARAVPDDVVEKAWNQFNAGISDGPDSPYPGMATAFEKYYSQRWTDKEWRNETSVWAAAWKEATERARSLTSSAEPARAVGDEVSVPRGLLERICAPRIAQGDLGLNWQITRDKSIDELRALLAAAPAERKETADELRAVLLDAFPLWDEAGCDEKEHCCEWTMLKERQRLHRLIVPVPSAEKGDSV